MRSLAVVAVAACLSALVGAVPNSYFINRTDTCMASVALPSKPLPLTFCYSTKHNSCCTPTTDAGAKSAYFGMMSPGQGCSPMEHSIRAAFSQVRDFFCLPCDPDEPKYRFRQVDGDVANGQAPDPTAAEDAFVWRVCASWLYGKDDKSGLWGGDGRKFDQCGVTLPAPCQPVAPVSWDSVNQTWVTGTPTIPANIQCGTETITPSAEYGTDAADQREAARNFLAALPQWLPNFQFSVVNDSDPNFNYTATPCFRGAAAGRGAVLVAIVAALALSLLASSF